MQNNGNAPAAQGNQNQGQYKNKGYGNQNNFKPRSAKNTQHRYEKKEGQHAEKAGKKGDKNQSEQKKYVTKQKANAPKTEQPAKAEEPAKTEAPAKAIDNAASQWATK